MIRELTNIRIEKLVAGGDGLARHEGKIILVPYVLPGELVDLNIIEDKTQYLRAEVAKVKEASPGRIESPCSLFTQCGGCDWLHIDYPSQTALKKDIIRDAFSRTGKLELPDFILETGSPLGYRNRAAFQCNDKGQAGFMQRNSNSIIPIQQCPVLHPDLNNILKASSSIKFRRNFKEPVFADGQQTYLQLPSEKSKIIKVELLGKTIAFDLDCFFQSNLELLPSLIQYVLKDISGQTAMDLFCGVGLFGAFMQDYFEQIIAVEVNKKSLEYARINIRPGNHIFINSDVTTLKKNTFKPGSVECILVDPPRNGLTTGVREFISYLKPDKILYVSCNPVTQARDTRDFLQKNYSLTDFRAFDFYPQTSHCETVLKLQLNS